MKKGASRLTSNSDSSGAVVWHRRRFVRIGATLVAVIAVLGAALLGAYWPFTERRIAQSLEEEFAGKVTIGHFRGTVFPHPGGVAEEVVFRWPTESADKGPLVKVKKLTVQANYWDLVLRPGYVSRIILEGLLIHVPPIGSGTAPQMNGTPSRTRLGEVVAEGAVLEVARQRGDTLKFEIHSLKLSSVSDGAPFGYEVALRNPLPPGEIRSSGKFGPWSSADAGQTAVSGTYSFDGTDLGVFEGIAGKLSSEGGFEGTLGHINAKGKIDIPNFEVTRSEHSEPVKSQYQAVVNATNGDVALERVDSMVLKTRVLAKGTVAGRESAEGKFASIDLTVNQGRIQDVLWLFVKAKRPPLNGVTSFRAHVTIPPTDAPFVRKVLLVGDFGVEDAQFTKAKTQESIAALSVRGAGKKPEEAEQEDPDAVLSDLSGHVELRGGTATFSEFSFSVPDARATMHGTYSLIDQKVDLHGILRTTAKFSETTSGVKSVLLKPFDAFFKRKKGGAKLPVQLTGTYHDPHAGLELIR